MENVNISLNELEEGRCAKVECLHSSGALRRRMLDLGLVSGTLVQAIQKSPCGDPVAYFIRGTVIALRNEDAKKITARMI